MGKPELQCRSNGLRSAMDRWDVTTGLHFFRNGKAVVPFASFVVDMYKWDYSMYNIGLREGIYIYIDPQCRILMDLTSQALAFDTQRVGVHIGLLWTDYMKLCGPLDANWSSYATIGNGVSFTVAYLSPTVSPALVLESIPRVRHRS